MTAREPPRTLAELRARARALAGRSLSELSAELSMSVSGPSVRRKGKVGTLLERALGAQGGSLDAPDFPELGVELKTIPVDPQGRARESTFVCSLGPLRDADRAEWASSLVKKKLAHVLWVPIVHGPAGEHVGAPLFWQPSAAQEAILRSDFDDIVGLVAIGQVERLSARVGRWLQARPKAAHGRVRTRAYGADGEPISAMPRGFYMRARITSELLRDPDTLLGDA